MLYHIKIDELSPLYLRRLGVVLVALHRLRTSVVPHATSTTYMQQFVPENENVAIFAQQTRQSKEAKQLLVKIFRVKSLLERGTTIERMIGKVDARLMKIEKGLIEDPEAVIAIPMSQAYLKHVEEKLIGDGWGRAIPAIYNLHNPILTAEAVRANRVLIADVLVSPVTVPAALTTQAAALTADVGNKVGRPAAAVAAALTAACDARDNKEQVKKGGSLQKYQQRSQNSQKTQSIQSRERGPISSQQRKTPALQKQQGNSLWNWFSSLSLF